MVYSNFNTSICLYFLFTLFLANNVRLDDTPMPFTVPMRGSLRSYTAQPRYAYFRNDVQYGGPAVGATNPTYCHEVMMMIMIMIMMMMMMVMMMMMMMMMIDGVFIADDPKINPPLFFDDCASTAAADDDDDNDDDDDAVTPSTSTFFITI